METGAPRLRARSDEASCPLCREALGRDDDPWRCAGCGVLYHDDCAQELGGCSTIDCAHQGEGPPVSEADEILAALRARPLDEPEERAPRSVVAARLPPTPEESTPEGSMPEGSTPEEPTPEERAREERDREAMRAWAQANGYGDSRERANWKGSFFAWTGLAAVLLALLLVAGERKGTPLSAEEVLVLLGVYLALAVPMLISWRLAR